MLGFFLISEQLLFSEEEISPMKLMICSVTKLIALRISEIYFPLATLIMHDIEKGFNFKLLILIRSIFYVLYRFVVP
jgi:hypothetical protein